MSLLSRGQWLLVGLVVWGCGKSRPAYLDETYGNGGPGADGANTPWGGAEASTSGTGTGTGGSGSTVPNSGTCGTSQGKVCGCLDLAFVSDVPNLYFVLDRSGSMNEQDKWTKVRSAVARVMTQLGPRARFAAAVYPASTGAPCATGVEVMDLLPGDSPPGRVGPTTLRLLSATAVSADGATPTATTLASLAPKLKALSGRTFVVLATDGGPNCGPDVGCSVQDCIPNIEQAAPICAPNGTVNCCSPPIGTSAGCLDRQTSVDVIRSLKAAGIPTYVIGMPGSAPYAAVLQAMASAGGTQRYLPAEPIDSIHEALAKVAAQITGTCILHLESIPDPTKVNVYLDERAIPKDDQDGWKLVGKDVELVGATCKSVLAGEALNVRVVAGCPTVVLR